MCSAGTCSARFPEGSLVQLNAIATTGSFLGWQTACRGQEACSITMDRDQSVGAVFGNPGRVLWVKQVGSSGPEDGASVAVDSDDNLIAVGSFYQTITLAPGSELRSDGLADIYITKLASSTGEPIWQKRVGGTGSEQVHGVVVDALNNIYILGTSSGTVDFGDGPRSSIGTFLLKLDENGVFHWVHTRIGTAHKLAISGDTVVTTGFFTGSVTIDATTFTSPIATPNFYVLKMSAATGATAWAKPFGAANAAQSSDIAIDGDGSIVLVGFFYERVNFGGSTLSAPSALDGFLLKLSGEGFTY